MKKKVLLLAVSCKNGGLCPGGIDLNNPKKWIRIVADDGKAGAVQGIDIDFAEPLDVITFNGHPVPQGKQQENWAIDNFSCRNLGKGKLNGRSDTTAILNWAYKNYGYHGFWDNSKPYLNEDEFDAIEAPSETILKVSDVHIYNNDFGKSKIDFKWSRLKYKICGISMTDQDYYERLNNGHTITFGNAYIVISIPKEADFVSMNGERRAYKFVSRVYEIPSL